MCVSSAAALCTDVRPAALNSRDMCAIPLRARSRRSAGVKVSRLPTRSNTSRAFSATRPVSSPLSRKKRPSGGSGVSFVMPASSSALLLYQVVWPPRCATETGCSVVASSRSFRVSGRSSFVSSNMNPSIQTSGALVSDFCRIAAWISRTVRRFVLTPNSSSTPLGWQCASMNPGTTVICCASIVVVRAVARLRTSAFDPTATKRPCLTANACARGSAGSLVNTRALTTIRSGSAASAGAAGGCCSKAARPKRGPRPSVNAPASTAPNPRNSPRVYLGKRCLRCAMRA